MGTSQELRDLPRQSSRALYVEGEGEADRENDGEITSGMDGFGTEQRCEESRGTRGMANVGCQVVWCPNGPQDYGIHR